MADLMKQAVEETKEDAAKVVDEVKEQAKPVVERAKKSTEKVIEEVREQAKPVVERAKRGTKKAAEKTAETAAKAKTAVEKVARKAVTGEITPVVYVQYMGEEEKVEDLVAAAKAAFSAEYAHTKVTDLRLYIKPEERAAYYVVNEKFAGKVDF